MVRNVVDSVLLIGFGGPTQGCCQRYQPCVGSGQESPEAYCFVSEILARRIKGNRPINSERVSQVVAHYTELGGFSPFNELTSAQASALSIKANLPVYIGMRNWRPFLLETLANMIDDGCRKILAIILSPFQTFTSWQEYQQDVNQALESLSTQNGQWPDIMVNYTSGWSAEDGYISAVTEKIRSSCMNWSNDRFLSAHLIFTAHAIPIIAAECSPYSQQFAQSSKLVADQLKKKFSLAYQSAPENSPIDWTEPDINTLIPSLDLSVSTDVIIVPLGFTCDHVEVLYDLDREAKLVAENNGFEATRVPTVGTSTAFISLLAQKVQTANET